MNQLLTFLAVGTPGGQPPWLLLNGVQLNNLASVPEPNTMLLGQPPSPSAWASTAVTAARPPEPRPSPDT
ncbi:MAG: hypothetical protein U0835_02310 [Isosphaeraceae bacterium]